MEGHHQSSSHRSSPTDADHLQRITALTVNVGKISKSNIGQSNSSANQRSAAQNTMANSASSGGSSDPILAMEKLVKNRIPNSSTSRSWIVSHWLWIIVLVQIQKKVKMVLLTSQCKCHDMSYFLTLVKLFRHNPHLALLGLKFSDIMGPIKALLFILDNQKPFVQILMRVVLWLWVIFMS